MRNPVAENNGVRPEGEEVRQGRLIQAAAHWWTTTLHFFIRRRIRWEVTAARLDDPTKRNLEKWAKIILASGEEKNPQARVLVILQEEERDVVTSILAVAEGHWTNS